MTNRFTSSNSAKASIGIFMSLLVSSLVHAQEAANAQPRSDVSARVQLEVFEGPQVKKTATPAYSIEDRRAGIEGWIEVGLMVDPKGRPYEITVLNSSGENPGLAKATLDAIKEWRFKPATLDGKPIDASFSTKVVYRLADNANGATPRFFEAFNAFGKSVAANDKIAAEAALTNMKVQNLYEDAYLGIAQYGYAERWGSIAQQLAAIRRAVALEKTATYLPEKLFSFAIQQRLTLELATQDYASALLTWPLVQKSNVDKAELEKYKAEIDEILVLQNDNRAYRVAAHLEEGRWTYKLLKRTIRLNVAEGRLSQIKLRCDKRYVFFQYDAAMEYEIAERYGMCDIEVIGDGNSKFDLIQR